ncbi:hypothetical protein [Nocardioides sp. YIM 152588]|uniref:hypothetical protein n=1 Tax=Nocardioides sp. YIM 152588 TaxID=3158259 RepID=UPI0032E42FF3
MNSRRTLTRGSLPPGIYWRRRFFVIALAGTLVFLIGSLLSGGSDGVSSAPVASQAGVVEPSGTVTVAPGTKKKRKNGKKAGQQAGTKSGKGSGATGPVFGPSEPVTELAEPSGPCAADDVLVASDVEDAVAGRDVTIGLRLQTQQAEACTWRLNRRTALVKILDNGREVWTSRQCPGLVPEETVVVRRIIATVVEMTWTEARESDEGCTPRAGWAQPGDYTLVTSAIGGEPSETTFDLDTPTAVTETIEVTPDQPKAKKAKKTKKAKKAKKTENGRAQRQEGDEPTPDATPSGEPRR